MCFDHFRPVHQFSSDCSLPPLSYPSDFVLNPSSPVCAVRVFVDVWFSVGQWSPYQSLYSFRELSVSLHRT